MAQIGLGWLTIRYLINRDRGTKEPANALLIAGLFGVLAVVLSYGMNSRFVADAVAGSGAVALFGAARAALMIGLIEESAKLLPLAWWLYHKKYFNEVTDGIIYFGTTAMMFGIIENVLYTLSYGGEVGLVRLVTVPFMHAGFSVWFGWLLARHKAYRNNRLLVLAGYLIAIGLHAAYNFGLMYGTWYSGLASLVLVIVANGAIFYLYGRAERRDRRLGLSAAGRDNWYCPFCGRPNPERHLRCPRCGRKT